MAWTCWSRCTTAPNSRRPAPASPADRDQQPRSKRFVTDLDITIGLLRDIPADRLVVSESGIHTPDDVAYLRSHGVHAFLVGEAFMRAPDPGVRLAELFAD